VKLFTIGFTKKSAEVFFGKLQEARVKRLLDVRLNNVSQLAGFSKKDDLRYFLSKIGAIDYKHLTDLAPTQSLLDEYKKRTHDWSKYETQFLQLMVDRRVEERVPKVLFDNACLLCSEETPDHCHRRLVAEYLKQKWPDVEIVHIS